MLLTRFMMEADETQMKDCNENVLLEELEILESIYINELDVQRSESGDIESIGLQLHPATGENIDEQFVCLTLQITPTQKYPDELPGISIRNPRGLAEEHVNSLRKELLKLAEDRIGGHMIYELIELAKESLTQSNVPHGACAVCLEVFDATDVFSKTECYHYFHSYCLMRHVEIAERELKEEKQQQHLHSATKKDTNKMVGCPVCRKAISYDLEALRSAPAPGAQDQTYKPDEKMLALQLQMSAMYRKQKEKGGIIDLEEEKKKLMLSHAQELVNEAEASKQTPPDQTEPSQVSKQYSHPDLKISSNQFNNREKNKSAQPNWSGRGTNRSGSGFSRSSRGRGRGREDMRPSSGSSHDGSRDKGIKDDVKRKEWRDKERDDRQRKENDRERVQRNENDRERVQRNENDRERVQRNENDRERVQRNGNDRERVQRNGNDRERVQRNERVVDPAPRRGSGYRGGRGGNRYRPQNGGQKDAMSEEEKKSMSSQKRDEDSPRSDMYNDRTQRRERHDESRRDPAIDAIQSQRDGRGISERKDDSGHATRGSYRRPNSYQKPRGGGGGGYHGGYHQRRNEWPDKTLDENGSGNMGYGGRRGRARDLQIRSAAAAVDPPPGFHQAS